MNYTLVFEPTYFNHPLTIFTLIIALVLFFVAYKIFQKSLVFTNDIYNISILKYFIIFLGFVALIYPDPITYMEVKKILEEKKYYIVEGTVNKFKEGRAHRGQYNSFNINDIDFSFDDFTLNYYYHKVAKSGSFISENGQSVKIFYVKKYEGNRIIKMWVKR